MNNLDLHNKLLHVAKQVAKLKEDHPELEQDLGDLTQTLRGELSATPTHQLTPSPYHRS